MHAGTPYRKVKWFCSVVSSDVYYLHDDLKIHHGAAISEEETDEPYHTGFFESEEEALNAYEKYYYLHAKEPGH